MMKRFAAACVSAVTSLAVLCMPSFGICDSISTVYSEAESRLEDEELLAVDPTGRGEGYLAVLYDSTNGLPTGEANTVIQSSDGFLWIGCYSGLIRYDGCNFTRIDSASGIASENR